MGSIWQVTLADTLLGYSDGLGWQRGSDLGDVLPDYWRVGGEVRVAFGLGSLFWFNAGPSPGLSEAQSRP